MKNFRPIQIAILFEEEIFRLGLATALEKQSIFNVALKTKEPTILIEALSRNSIEIVILENHFAENARFYHKLKKVSPKIKVIVLTNFPSKFVVNWLIKLKINGILLKTAPIENIKNAILNVYRTGYWNNSLYFKALQAHLIDELKFTPKEYEFIALCCTCLSYQDIADKMFIATSTIDKYRNQVFKKLNIKSRIALITYALNNGIVSWKNFQKYCD